MSNISKNNNQEDNPEKYNQNIMMSNAKINNKTMMSLNNFKTKHFINKKRKQNVISIKTKMPDMGFLDHQLNSNIFQIGNSSDRLRNIFYKIPISFLIIIINK